MIGFDFAVTGIFLVSLLLGLWRGLIYEVLSLLGWPIAFVLSRVFVGDIAPIMPGTQEVIRVSLAYVAIFVVALIVWGVLAWLISRLIKAIGLGWLDRVLGGIFGLLRGGLIVIVLAWLAGLTEIPKQPFWQIAKMSKTVEDFALLTKIWLPDNIASRIHYPVRDR